MWNTPNAWCDIKSLYANMNKFVSPKQKPFDRHMNYLRNLPVLPFPTTLPVSGHWTELSSTHHRHLLDYVHCCQDTWTSGQTGSRCLKNNTNNWCNYHFRLAKVKVLAFFLQNSNTRIGWWVTNIHTQQYRNPTPCLSLFIFNNTRIYGIMLMS